MMFSSKAEERVDKKDMVRDFFMCILPVLFLYRSVFSCYNNFIYLFMLPTGPFCNF